MRIPKQIKSVSTIQYKNKLTFLFLIISIFVVLTPFVTGWMLYGMVRDARQIYSYIPDKETGMGINSTAKRYTINAEEIQKSLTDLHRVIYESQTLQATLAEEFLGSGLAVDNFTVRTVNAANKAKTIPSKGSEDWKYFNFATVALNGSLDVDKVSQFLLFLATRQKLWYISALEFQPMDTPADWVNRFQAIETDITVQGRTFERDSLLENINKRANKKKLTISVTFFVPISV
jgi:nitrate reductase NapE component